MSISRKAAAMTAAAVLLAPIGVAQATDESGKAGAPGQVCKTVHPNSKQAKAALDAFKGAEPRSKAAVRAFRKTQQAAYKGCIKGAADARSHEDAPAEQPTTTTPAS